MEELVSPSEPTARFITQRSYYRSSDKTVKHNAYMPNKNGETSIYRTTGITDSEIYKIGQKYVGEEIGRSIKGHAEIVTSEIIKHELAVKADPSPHPRHANIIDWPEDKTKQRIIAVELADKALLHLIPHNLSGSSI